MGLRFSLKWLLVGLMIGVCWLLTAYRNPSVSKGAVQVTATGDQHADEQPLTLAVTLTSTVTTTTTTAAPDLDETNTVTALPAPWIEPSPLNPTIVEESLTLAADEQRVITVPVQGATVLFLLHSTMPLTVTLVDPTGWVITPATPASEPRVMHGAGEGNLLMMKGWSTIYEVAQPAAGDWQVQITTATPNSLILYGAVKANRQMRTKTDKVAYQPGELITLQVSLEEEGIPQIGTAISGTLTLPNGTATPLTFADDGLQGDAVSQDGIYSARFNAPPMNSRPEIHLRAAYKAIVQIDTLSIDVVGPTATFQGVSGERAVDTDGNGLFDHLALALLVNVQTAGSYAMRGVLVDQSGQELALGIYATPHNTILASGIQTVTLFFDGETLRNRGSDGPYTLTNLFLDYNDPTVFSPFTVGLYKQIYTTAAYRYRQFEGYLIKLVGSNEAVIDGNKDGLYDQLQINVQLDLLAPGVYGWSGQLVAQNGTSIGWSSGGSYLDSQTPLTFTFTGSALQRKGAARPYQLRNVAVYRTGGAPLSMYWGLVHTSAAYPVDQFEQAE